MPGDSNETTATGKKRRLETQQSDDESSDEESAINDESDSDQGLTHEEKIARKKKKKAARLKKKAEQRRSALVGNLAASHETPASTGLSRALQEWIRFMLGVSRKSKASVDSKLPLAPTDEERKQWMDRKRSREAKIDAAIDKAMKRYIAKKQKKDPKFKPNQTQIATVEKDAASEVMSSDPLKPVTFSSQLSFTTRSKYSHLWGSKCEGALALAGFPRCTLDWEAGYDTPWNSAMTSILIQQWVKCYDANGAKGFGISHDENTSQNQEEIVRRWVENQVVNYRRQIRDDELKQTEVGRKQVDDQKAMEKKKESRRRALDKIHDARVALVDNIFGSTSPEAKMVSYREVHSEDEIKSTARSATRTKVRKEWRSAELDTFLGFCDTSIVSRETLPRTIAKAKLITERGPYSSVSDQDSLPPKGFQKSLVSPTWLAGTKKLTVISLELKDHNEVNIEKSLNVMMDLLQKTGGDSPPVASGSGT